MSVTQKVAENSAAKGFLNERICVVGPGAIGTTMAVKLGLSGLQVTVAARSESLEVIKRRGVRLLDPQGDYMAALPAGVPRDLGEQDLIFLCPKSQDLEGMAEWIQPLIHSRTTIVPMINGIPWWYHEGEKGRFSGRAVHSVDPANRLKKLLPSNQILGAVMLFTAERLKPGFARSMNPLRVTVGELNNITSRRCEDVAKVLNHCGIYTKTSQRIRDALWTKVIANLFSNPLSVIAGASIKDICSHPALTPITRQLLDEGLLIAAAYGARIELDPQALLAMGGSMGDEKTSMLQDFESGRALELSSICEAVIELAELHNIPVPLTRNILTLASYKSSAARARGSHVRRLGL